MTPDAVFIQRPWLLWVHDPCMEGGWHIRGGFETREEAEAEAKAQHEREMKDIEDMRKDYPEYHPCYDGCAVTPGFCFELDVPQEGSKTNG